MNFEVVMFESRYFRVFWSVTYITACYYSGKQLYFIDRGTAVKFKLINEHQQVIYSAMTN